MELVDLYLGNVRYDKVPENPEIDSNISNTIASQSSEYGSEEEKKGTTSKSKSESSASGKIFSGVRRFSESEKIPESAMYLSNYAHKSNEDISKRSSIDESFDTVLEHGMLPPILSGPIEPSPSLNAVFEHGLLPPILSGPIASSKMNSRHSTSSSPSKKAKKKKPRPPPPPPPPPPHPSSSSPSPSPSPSRQIKAKTKTKTKVKRNIRQKPILPEASKISPLEMQASLPAPPPETSNTSRLNMLKSLKRLVSLPAPPPETSNTSRIKKQASLPAPPPPVFKRGTILEVVINNHWFAGKIEEVFNVDPSSPLHDFAKVEMWDDDSIKVVEFADERKTWRYPSRKKIVELLEREKIRNNRKKKKALQKEVQDDGDKNKALQKEVQDDGDKNKALQKEVRDDGDRNKALQKEVRDDGEKNKALQKEVRDNGDKNKALQKEVRDDGDRNKALQKEVRDDGEKNKALQKEVRDNGDKNKALQKEVRDDGDRNKALQKEVRDDGEKNKALQKEVRDNGDKNKALQKEVRDDGDRNKALQKEKEERKKQSDIKRTLKSTVNHIEKTEKSLDEKVSVAQLSCSFAIKFAENGKALPWFHLYTIVAGKYAEIFENACLSNTSLLHREKEKNLVMNYLIYSTRLGRLSTSVFGTTWETLVERSNIDRKTTEDKKINERKKMKSYYENLHSWRSNQVFRGFETYESETDDGRYLSSEDFVEGSMHQFTTLAPLHFTENIFSRVCQVLDVQLAALLRYNTLMNNLAVKFGQIFDLICGGGESSRMTESLFQKHLGNEGVIFDGLLSILEKKNISKTRNKNVKSLRRQEFISCSLYQFEALSAESFEEEFFSRAVAALDECRKKIIFWWEKRASSLVSSEERKVEHLPSFLVGTPLLVIDNNQERRPGIITESHGDTAKVQLIDGENDDWVTIDLENQGKHWIVFNRDDSISWEMDKDNYANVFRCYTILGNTMTSQIDTLLSRARTAEAWARSAESRAVFAELLCERDIITTQRKPKNEETSLVSRNIVKRLEKESYCTRQPWMKSWIKGRRKNSNKKNGKKKRRKRIGFDRQATSQPVEENADILQWAKSNYSEKLTEAALRSQEEEEYIYENEAVSGGGAGWPGNLRSAMLSVIARKFTDIFFLVTSGMPRMTKEMYELKLSGGKPFIALMEAAVAAGVIQSNAFGSRRRSRLEARGLSRHEYVTACLYAFQTLSPEEFQTHVATIYDSIIQRLDEQILKLSNY
eukprot:g1391.t1